MARYHVSSSGKPAKCSATKVGCPLGGDAPHFDSPKEAQEFIERENSEKYGVNTGVSKVTNFEIPTGYKVKEDASVLSDEVSSEVTVATFTGSKLLVGPDGKVTPEDTVFNDNTLRDINNDLRAAKQLGSQSGLDSNFDYKAHYDDAENQIVINRITPGSAFTQFDNISHDYQLPESGKGAFKPIRPEGYKPVLTNYHMTDKDAIKTRDNLNAIAKSYQYSEIGFNNESVDDVNSVDYNEIDMAEVMHYQENVEGGPEEYDERIVVAHNSFTTVAKDSFERGDYDSVSRNTRVLVDSISDKSLSDGKTIKDSLHDTLKEDVNLHHTVEMNDSLIENEAVNDMQEKLHRINSDLSMKHSGKPPKEAVLEGIKEFENYREERKSQARREKKNGRIILQNIQKLSPTEFADFDTTSTTAQTRVPILNNLITRAESNQVRKMRDKNNIAHLFEEDNYNNARKTA